jgi:hypothetical protein
MVIMIDKWVWVYSLKQVNEYNLNLKTYDHSSKGQYLVGILISKAGNM